MLHEKIAVARARMSVSFHSRLQKLQCNPSTRTGTYAHQTRHAQGARRHTHSGQGRHRHSKRRLQAASMPSAKKNTHRHVLSGQLTRTPSVWQSTHTHGTGKATGRACPYAAHSFPGREVMLARGNSPGVRGRPMENGPTATANSSQVVVYRLHIRGRQPRI